MRLLATLVMALTATIGTAATGQTAYPAKPIKIVVAYPAGQGTDIAARYLSEQVAKELGQPIVIDNKAGAGGNIGTAAVAQSPGDGYTLTMGTNATHALNAFLYASVGFDPEKDFEPVALIGTFPMVVAVRADSPLKSAADLIATSRREPRAADIAMPSTTARLVVELLREQTKAPLFGVPYKGSGNAITDLLGGQLPVVVDTPTALRPHLASGRLRALGVTSSQRSGLVPGVPTVAEQGITGFEVIAWNALYAPKGTPPNVIATLNAAFNKVLARPETRSRLLELGFDPAGGNSMALRDFAASERAKWGPLIKTAGIKLD
jgi:tripartite-type tricarboxylate transporter receptor subunit TctC